MKPSVPARARWRIVPASSYAAIAPRYSGTAAAAAALLLATVFAVLQMREAQAQRDQARFQQKRAEAESQFMTLMMSTVGSGERPVTSGQILGNGIQLLDRQYGNDPKFQVDMLIRMAARFMDLGETDAAVPGVAAGGETRQPAA